MFWTRVVEEINTHFVFSSFFPRNRAVYEITWKNIVERGRPQMAIWRMRIACWITKAINTHLQYVICIAFPLQQCFQEHTCMLHYMHIACLVLQQVLMNLGCTKIQCILTFGSCYVQF